jgi:hypothetical protein
MIELDLSHRHLRGGLGVPRLISKSFFVHCEDEAENADEKSLLIGLSHNLLDSLPKLDTVSISLCKQTIALDVSSNPLIMNSSFSEELRTFSNLKELRLRDTGLTDLACLSGATTLEHLDVSFNSINQVTGLGSMGNLMSLRMAYNSIKSVQSIRILMMNRKLVVLDVTGNPLAADTGYVSKIKNVLISLEVLNDRILADRCRTSRWRADIVGLCVSPHPPSSPTTTNSVNVNVTPTLSPVKAKLNKSSTKEMSSSHISRSSSRTVVRSSKANVGSCETSPPAMGDDDAGFDSSFSTIRSRLSWKSVGGDLSRISHRTPVPPRSPGSPIRTPIVQSVAVPVGETRNIMSPWQRPPKITPRMTNKEKGTRKLNIDTNEVHRHGTIHHYGDKPPTLRQQQLHAVEESEHSGNSLRWLLPVLQLNGAQEAVPTLPIDCDALETIPNPLKVIHVTTASSPAKTAATVHEIGSDGRPKASDNQSGVVNKTMKNISSSSSDGKNKSNNMGNSRAKVRTPSYTQRYAGSKSHSRKANGSHHQASPASVAFTTPMPMVRSSSNKKGLGLSSDHYENDMSQPVTGVYTLSKDTYSVDVFEFKDLNKVMTGISPSSQPQPQPHSQPDTVLQAQEWTPSAYQARDTPRSKQLDRQVRHEEEATLHATSSAHEEDMRAARARGDEILETLRQTRHMIENS